MYLLEKWGQLIKRIKSFIPDIVIILIIAAALVILCIAANYKEEPNYEGTYRVGENSQYYSYYSSMDIKSDGDDYIVNITVFYGGGDGRYEKIHDWRIAKDDIGKRITIPEKNIESDNVYEEEGYQDSVLLITGDIAALQIGSRASAITFIKTEITADYTADLIRVICIGIICICGIALIIHTIRTKRYVLPIALGIIALITIAVSRPEYNPWDGELSATNDNGDVLLFGKAPSDHTEGNYYVSVVSFNPDTKTYLWGDMYNQPVEDGRIYMTHTGISDFAGYLVASFYIKDEELTIIGNEYSTEKIKLTPYIKPLKDMYPSAIEYIPGILMLIGGLAVGGLYIFKKNNAKTVKKGHFTFVKYIYLSPEQELIKNYLLENMNPDIIIEDTLFGIAEVSVNNPQYIKCSSAQAAVYEKTAGIKKCDVYKVLTDVEGVEYYILNAKNRDCIAHVVDSVILSISEVAL